MYEEMLPSSFSSNLVASLREGADIVITRPARYMRVYCEVVKGGCVERKGV